MSIPAKFARLGRIVLGLMLVTTILVGIFSAFRSGRGLRDFGSFTASGVAAPDGRNPYGVYQDTYQVTFQGSRWLHPISTHPFPSIPSD